MSLENMLRDEREALDFLLREEFGTMQTFKIYLEPADTDEQRTYLGSVKAMTMSEALYLAAQWNEIPQHDLVAVAQGDENQFCTHGQYRSLCPECSPLA